MSLGIAFVIVLFIEALVMLGADLFVKYKKLDELESYFSENDAIQRNKRFWRKNRLIDKTMRLSVIIGFLMQPQAHIKAGKVTAKELASVPLALRRWATWPFYFGIAWLLACCMGLVWQKW
ncbi:hypothetical protein [Pseudomonas sp. PAMC 26793]|uniref:hypothetical protein n=1 Tax=Pseudomonas sp. PAMC 26793 TaxID=1240676 RepID=UPI000379D796|nr:hypothetical protein [Pseudomonas sp. PAMC 26793]